MKLNTIHIVALGLTFSLVSVSCDSFDNPNAATESQVLTTVDGLTALAIGMKREYQINSLTRGIVSSGLSAREFGVVVGLTSSQDLEAGGTNVRSDNGISGGIWRSSYAIIGMADDLIASTDIVPEEATRNAFVATGNLFKAIALGNLYMFWPFYPDNVDIEGDGEFTDRVEALQTAIASLEAGLSALGGTDVPADFQSKVLGTPNFDLEATLNAFLARYHGFLGNHSTAIAAADRALAASTISEWTYESGGGNVNPMFELTTEGDAPYRPLDNFGLDTLDYVVPDEDGRKAFYISPSDEIGESSRLPVEVMHGFYDERTGPIPVFLPGEMYLIKAEAQALSNDLGGAVASLNMVRTKTDDPWGVNANLPPYDGPNSQDAILTDVYRNRRVELFVIGTSLEDSRRFDLPIQANPPDFTSYDRNRNFYPYPENERDNNPNTPTDPPN